MGGNILRHFLNTICFHGDSSSFVHFYCTTFLNFVKIQMHKLWLCFGKIRMAIAESIYERISLKTAAVGSKSNWKAGAIITHSFGR